MRVLVIGSGGREHALAWKLRESQQTDDIYCAPGNPGVTQEAECLPVDVSRPHEILELARQLKVDLTVVGPEAPLVAGVVDEFEQAGLAILGPTRAASQLEGSKIFSKQFMQRHRIPTARFAIASDLESAIKAAAVFPFPVVIKADGLAAGKGVVIARTQEEVEETLERFMRQRTLGPAGERVVIEECLRGKELSFIVLTDGRGILPLPPTQDHKAVFDNDEGPNTGGMGAYCPAPIGTPELMAQVEETILVPTVHAMKRSRHAFRGVLYAGLMLTNQGPRVLEFNCRFGDPETQPLMMRLKTDLLDLLEACVEDRLDEFPEGRLEWDARPAVCVV